MVEYVTCHENRVENFESGATSKVDVFFLPIHNNIILVITI